VESRRIRSEVDRAADWLRRADNLGGDTELDLFPLVEACRDRLEASYGNYWYKAFVTASTEADAGAAFSGDRVLTAEATIRNFEFAEPEVDRPATIPVYLHAKAAGQHNAVATYCSVCVDDRATLTTSPFSEVRPSSWGGQFVSALAPLDVKVDDPIPMQVEITPTSTPAVRYRRTGPSGLESIGRRLFEPTRR
jgi:hypothetical protein